MNETARVLVVEDEAIVAMALQARLENLGYAVVGEVASGEEAIERAAEQIRVRFDIPVVYLTALADQATLQRAKLTGPFSYLLKPVEERALHSAVEVALYKHGMERRLKESAHEVINLLAIIQSFFELLMAELEGSLRNDAFTIFEEAQRATQVVQDLLPPEGRHQSSKAEVSAIEILQTALRLKAFHFRVDHIEVQLDLAADVPEVMAHKNQLLQVFINILTNAQQAMAEAPSGRNLRIQGRRVDRNVRISFADDGPGISEDNLNKIFDRGFTTKEVDGGKGLGLFVSRGIVREHSGELWTESEPGRGATFHLELPGLPLHVSPEVASPGRLK